MFAVNVILNQSISSHQVSNALDAQTWMAILLLPIILLSFIRDLRTLAPLSIAANICCALSLIIIFQYIVRNIHHTEELPAFAGWSNFPVFFGIALYAFEGIGVVRMALLMTKASKRACVKFTPIFSCLFRLVLHYLKTFLRESIIDPRFYCKNEFLRKAHFNF